MIGKHTPGRLHIETGGGRTTVLSSEQGYAVAEPCDWGSIKDEDEREANARRLVACWNMLVGETTEDIEANPMPAMFDQLSVHLERLQKNCDAILAKHNELLAQVQELHRQRDMLLEVAKGFLMWAENQADAQSKGGHATFDMMMLREQRDLAEAAIAKAEGCTVREELP